MTVATHADLLRQEIFATPPSPARPAFPERRQTRHSERYAQQRPAQDRHAFPGCSELATNETIAATSSKRLKKLAKCLTAKLDQRTARRGLQPIRAITAVVSNDFRGRQAGSAAVEQGEHLVDRDLVRVRRIGVHARPRRTTRILTVPLIPRALIVCRQYFVAFEDIAGDLPSPRAVARAIRSPGPAES